MTIKIEVTPEEQNLIISALVFVDGSARAQRLANRFRTQTAKDPADDGPEVEILSKQRVAMFGPLLDFRKMREEDSKV